MTKKKKKKKKKESLRNMLNQKGPSTRLWGADCRRKIGSLEDPFKTKNQTVSLFLAH